MIEDLAAQQPAVAIVDPVARNDILQEAVARLVHPVETNRDRIAERASDPALDPAEAEIAEAEFVVLQMEVRKDVGTETKANPE